MARRQREEFVLLSFVQRQSFYCLNFEPRWDRARRRCKVQAEFVIFLPGHPYS